MAFVGYLAFMKLFAQITSFLVLLMSLVGCVHFQKTKLREMRLVKTDRYYFSENVVSSPSYRFVLVDKDSGQMALEVSFDKFGNEKHIELFLPESGFFMRRDDDILYGHEDSMTIVGHKGIFSREFRPTDNVALMTSVKNRELELKAAYNEIVP